jgi:hypothetical protein
VSSVDPVVQILADLDHPASPTVEFQQALLDQLLAELSPSCESRSSEGRSWRIDFLRGVPWHLGGRRLLVVLAVAVLVVVAVATASAIPRLILSPYGFPGQLRAGSKVEVTEAGVRFSFRVPAEGWEGHNAGRTRTSPRGAISVNQSIVGSQAAEAIIYWTSFPSGDHAVPCADLLGRSVGRSAAALAATVATAPGTKLVEGPSNVTLGGYRAKHVMLKVRKKVGCDPGFFYRWKTTLGGAFWVTTDAGDTMRVWIVAVGGTQLFIAAATSWQIHATHEKVLEKEIRQIVESIRFG